MSLIRYSRLREEVRNALQSAIELCSKVHRQSDPTWLQSLTEQLNTLDAKASLRIVLIGEFSAGKSSIISALTGNDIPIGADVTTTKAQEYPWNGVVLVDTPGVQSQADPVDHDRIARQTTIGADLVLFVITNELFNDRLASHLQFIIGDRGLHLANKTAIIVNKMDRETNGDEVICSEVSKALGSYGDLPIWFCAAGKYVQSAQTAAPMAARFRAESRMEDLAKQIDAFVSDRGAYGQLVRPLQVIEEALAEAHAALVGSADLKNELELLRRQKRILAHLRDEILSLKCVYRQKVQATVMKRADSSVKVLSEATTTEELETQIEQGLREASSDVESLVSGLEAELAAALNHAQDDLEELGNSPLAQAVLEYESREVSSAAIDLDTNAPGKGPGKATLMRKFLPALKDSLKAAAKDTKGMRDTVLTVGKSMGKKFRPWEATKAAERLAKGAGWLSKTLPYVAVAVDAYINYREEKAKDEQRAYVAGLRAAARRTFLDHASLEADAIVQSIDKFVDCTVGHAMQQVDARSAAIGVSRDADSTGSRRICELKASCAALWSRIERKSLDG